jgi:hypothetical protein
MATPPTAPKRQRVLDFLTPDVKDLLFYETVEGFRMEFPPYGEPHPDSTRWPDHMFVFAMPADEGGTTYRKYYAARREAQDRYNFEFSESSIGDSTFDSITRTYVVLRSEFDPYSGDSPKAGDLMPEVPDDRFGGEFVFKDRKQVRINDQRLDSLFVIEQHVYIKRVTARQIGTDQLNGKPLFSETTLHYGTEVITGGLTMAQLLADETNAFWGLRADGTEASGRRLSDNWYEITVRQVVAGTMSNGVLIVQAYSTNSNFYWPPVLDTLEFLDWQRRDGGTDIYPAIRFNPEGYNGPCRTTIQRSWSPTPFPNIPAVEPLQPTRIYYSSPFFSLNIPECLHGNIVAQCDIGSTDPVYALNSGSARLFPATNETTWPASIIADDDQEPYRGGYMRTVRTVFPPANEELPSFVPPPPTVWPSLGGYDAWDASMTYEFNINL